MCKISVRSSESILLCCQCFQFSGGGETNGLKNSKHFPCGFDFVLSGSTWICWKAERLLLAQTTHPRLLRSVIVIGFYPCFMRKDMLQEHIMFIMRIEILTVQFWHLHKVIRKGLASWKCKYPIYLETISWGLLWNVWQLTDLLLFACCLYVYESLAFIYRIFSNLIRTLFTVSEG